MDQSTFPQMKRESLEATTPTASTSSSAAAALEMVEVEMDDFKMNPDVELGEVDLEEEEEYDEEIGGHGRGQDYPLNYGAPRSEVEKLRQEVIRLREEVKLLEERSTKLKENLEKMESELAESEEDRMHARIILQYEKDEKEKFQKMFYDEQRQRNAVKGQLNAILGVKAKPGQCDRGEGGGSDDDTCLEGVMTLRPVIDRTKIYSTNFNNIGVRGSGGDPSNLLSPAPPPPQRPSKVVKAVGPKLGASGTGEGVGSRQPLLPPPPPPQVQTQTKTERRFKTYRGVGTLSRPRGLAPQPSTSQALAMAGLNHPQPSTSTSAGDNTSRTFASRTYVGPPRRGYKKRKGSSTALGHAAYFKRNKNKSNFPCNLCPQRFLKLSLLKYHKVKNHNVQDLSLEGVGCVECGSVFPDRKKLFDHRWGYHKIPRPYCGPSKGQGSNE